MNNSDLTPNEWSQRDEEVWNAWLNRNASKDKAQFVKAAKFAGIAAMVGVVLIFLWAWNSRVVRSVQMGVAAEHAESEVSLDL